MKLNYYILFLSTVFQACNSESISERNNSNSYAVRFSIQNEDSFDILSVYDPWQRATGEKLTYVLGEDPGFIPDSLAEFPFIKIPVSRVAVFSTTHIGFIEALDKTDGIVGVSGLDYVCNEYVRAKAEKGGVYELGYPPAINFERLIALSPDIVFMYGIESNIAGISNRLESSGISTVIIAEYLESHPLGKMEWIKVFGTFFDRKEVSGRIFENAREKYENLRQLTDTVKNKPEVLSGLPWKNTWYMSGGKSYTSRLIDDAGGSYLWKKNTSEEYIPLSLEAVMKRAVKADFWINTGSATSLAEISGQDSRFEKFRVFEEGKLFNNDARVCSNGGNEYWERGVVEPHIILNDLIKIFHPELVPDHDFAYYRKLE